MKPILLTNGDSWTQGDSPAQNINWGAPKSLEWYDLIPSFGNTYKEVPRKILYKFYDSPVWPKILGKNLKLETWNAGRLGSDNYGILYRTINSIEWLEKRNKNNIFVIIGWTSYLRLPVFVKKDKVLDLDQLRPNPTNLKLFYQDNLANQDMTVLIIYALQNYLKDKNIKFLFFNAFSELEDSSFMHLLDKNYWLNRDIKSAHFLEYILDKNKIKDWSDSNYFNCYHPKDNSHIQWGTFLTEYIKTNYEFN